MPVLKTEVVMAKSKEWPADNKPASFEDITDDLVKAVRTAYKLQPTDKPINWKGLPIGEDDRSRCLEIAHSLSPAQLKYSDEEQNRDPLTTILGVAVQLGIEQGRRIVKSSVETKAGALIQSALLSKLGDYQKADPTLTPEDRAKWDSLRSSLLA